jgi:UDP-N-acetylmuramoylalanine-D-glutamate ligase
VEDGMMITRALQFSILVSALGLAATGPAMAQSCTRQGVDVTCDDGRRGIFAGESIIWADGTRSNLVSPHPSVIIGNKSSVVIGPGVFAGNGKGGMVPMENPSAPNKARCPVLDGVSYCH